MPGATLNDLADARRRGNTIIIGGDRELSPYVGRLVTGDWVVYDCRRRDYESYGHAYRRVDGRYGSDWERDDGMFIHLAELRRTRYARGQDPVTGMVL